MQLFSDMKLVILFFSGLIAIVLLSQIHLKEKSHT